VNLVQRTPLSALRGLLALIALALGLMGNVASAKEAVEVGEEPWVEARMLHLSEELRCLVCQNETLASSRAELANDLRVEVRALVKQGKTDKEIKEYLVARYGDFVLYRPEVKPVTWLLWFGPFAVLLFALGLGWLYLRERQKNTAQQALDAAQRAQADQILNRTGPP
jgi:cytochrome c-type biogenesis protein CcmH